MLAGGLATLMLAVFAGQGLAATTQVVGWEDMSANLPNAASLSFNDVAATSGGLVVAVGSDSGAPALYHRGSGGSWVADTIAYPADVHATGAVLEGVAVGGATTWAVGTYTDSAGTHPLIVKADNAQLTGATAAWAFVVPPAPVAPQPAMALPTSVSMAPGGTVGLIGTSSADGTSGQVYAISDSAAGTVSQSPLVSSAQPLGVTGVSLYKSEGASGVYDGFAVTRTDATASASRIHQVRVVTAPALGGTLTAVSSSNANADLLGVATIQNGAAVDGIALQAGTVSAAPDYLQPSNSDGSSWTKPGDSAFTAASHPADVSIGVTGSSQKEAAAGDEGGRGTVWRCPVTTTGACGQGAGAHWVADDIGDALTGATDHNGTPFPKLNAVAVLSGADIWAAGNNGRIVEYHSHTVTTPDPGLSVPDTKIESGPAEGQTISTGSPTFTFSATGSNIGDPSKIAFACHIDHDADTSCNSPKPFSGLSEGEHTFTVYAVNAKGPDPTPATRTFFVRFPPKACTLPPAKLAGNVRIRKAPGKLLVAFKLRARARVRAIAVAGSRTVGRTSWHTLDRGRRQLVVRLRRTPTTLRLIARPATKCDT
jgi:hypothetical protein